MSERVRATVVIYCHFQNGEKTCQHLIQILPENNTIFAVEAAITTLDCYRYVDLTLHDVVVYSDWMSCLETIEGKDTGHPYICHAICLF